MAKSGHGAVIWWEPDPAVQGTFSKIGELGDITTPGLSRNEFDATTQNVDIDTYVLGVLRREGLAFRVNFMESGEATHDHLTGLVKGIIDNKVRGWKYVFPSGLTWVMSGQVQSVKITDPVDGLQSADCVARMSGKMYIGSTLVG